MAKALFNVLFNVFVALLNLILLPINSVLESFFPNVTEILTTLTTGINLFLGNGIAYFTNMLPPLTQRFILVYLGFLVTFYTLSFTIHAIIWAINVIKKLPLA